MSILEIIGISIIPSSGGRIPIPLFRRLPSFASFLFPSSKRRSSKTLAYLSHDSALVIHFSLLARRLGVVKLLCRCCCRCCCCSYYCCYYHFILIHFIVFLCQAFVFVCTISNSVLALLVEIGKRSWYLSLQGVLLTEIEQKKGTWSSSTGIPPFEWLLIYYYHC